MFYLKKDFFDIYIYIYYALFYNKYQLIQRRHLTRLERKSHNPEFQHLYHKIGLVWVVCCFMAVPP